MSGLSLESVSFRYGSREIFRDLTLQFSGRSIALILGRNGTGKSTLLRLAAGLLSPTSGRVLAEGNDLSTQPARERARLVAWLSQSTQLPGDQKVVDYLLSGRYARVKPWAPFAEGDRRAAREAISQLGAEHLFHRALGSLSGGQRQLVRIARALSQQTPYLLLDEPLGPLDLEHRSALWKALTALEGTTLVVSHDLAWVGRSCSRVVLLGEKGVLADGVPEEALRRENIEQAFGWTPPRDWSFARGPV